MQHDTQCVSSSDIVNSGPVHNQAVTQNVRGDIYNGPVYNNYGATHSIDTLVSDQTNPDRIAQEGRRRQWLKNSLLFETIDSRREAIKTAHASTSQWLIDSPEYVRWLSNDKLEKHSGFLWLKGKPGTGKSTLTKFVLDQATEKFGDTVIVSFFFNARGGALERSTLGICYVEKLPSAQSWPEVWPAANLQHEKQAPYEWQSEAIQRTLRKIMKGTNFLFFIDALDECDEDETRDMVGYFQDLRDTALRSNAQLRIFFASRHYPHITIQPCIELTLEDQHGHRQDMDVYLLKELKIGDTEAVKGIASEILRRASDIFLWIVLVVRILNKEYDRGRVHTLRRRLSEIPAGLEELFRSILTRDGQPDIELLRCVQWLLFSKRPLRLTELYFAILSSTGGGSSIFDKKTAVTRDDMARYVLHSSKGLVEVAKGRSGYVQFIHQSVPDYFSGTADLSASVFGPSTTLAARGHEQLKQDCYDYIMSLHDYLQDRSSIQNKCPIPRFHQCGINSRMCACIHPGRSCIGVLNSDSLGLFAYANTHMLDHAEKALSSGISQTYFIRQLDFQKWNCVSHLLRQPRQYPPEDNILYLLAKRHHYGLLEVELERTVSLDLMFEQYDFVLLDVQKRGCRKILELLLSLPNGRKGVNDLSGSKFTEQELQKAVFSLIGPVIDEDTYTPLSWAAHTGRLELVKCLVSNRRADINQGRSMKSRLEESDSHTHPYNVLLDADELSNRIRPPLSALASNGGAFVVPLREVLRPYNTPLHWAVFAGHTDVVKVLLTHEDIDVNCTNYVGLRPLDVAVRKRDADMVRILLKHRYIDTKVWSGNGERSLNLAIETGQTVIVKLLKAAASQNLNGYVGS